MPLSRPTRKPQRLTRSNYSLKKSNRQDSGYTPIKTLFSSLKKTKSNTNLDRVGIMQRKQTMSFQQPSVKLTAPRQPRLSSPAQLEWQTRTTSESSLMTEQPTGPQSVQAVELQQQSLQAESPPQQPVEIPSIPTLAKSSDPSKSQTQVSGTPTISISQ